MRNLEDRVFALRATLFRLRYLMVMTIASGTSSCSTIDTFAILNNTDAPLGIEYTLKKRGPADDHWEYLTLIATVASDEAGDADCPWRKLHREQYTYDPTTHKVTVQVPRATAIRIAELSNYRNSDKWWAERFPIASITIEGVRGTMHFSEEQARMAFTNLKRSLNAIDYR